MQTGAGALHRHCALQSGPFQRALRRCHLGSVAASAPCTRYGKQHLGAGHGAVGRRCAAQRWTEAAGGPGPRAPQALQGVLQTFQEKWLRGCAEFVLKLSLTSPEPPKPGKLL